MLQSLGSGKFAEPRRLPYIDSTSTSVRMSVVVLAQGLALL